MGRWAHGFTSCATIFGRHGAARWSNANSQPASPDHRTRQNKELTAKTRWGLGHISHIQSSQDGKRNPWCMDSFFFWKNNLTGLPYGLALDKMLCYCCWLAYHMVSCIGVIILVYQVQTEYTSLPSSNWVNKTFILAFNISKWQIQE